MGNALTHPASHASKGMQPKMGKWVADPRQTNKSDNKTSHIKIIKKENNNNSSSSSPIYPFIPIYPYVVRVSAWVRALPIAYPFTHF